MNATAQDRGTGMIATMLALPMVLLLLLLATQVLVRLQATSTATALAERAARTASIREDGRDDATRSAERWLRSELGAVGATADISWTVDVDRVTVRLRIPGPNLLATDLSGPLGSPITVRASARPEVWR